MFKAAQEVLLQKKETEPKKYHLYFCTDKHEKLLGKIVKEQLEILLGPAHAHCPNSCTSQEAFQTNQTSLTKHIQDFMDSLLIYTVGESIGPMVQKQNHATVFFNDYFLFVRND